MGVAVSEIAQQRFARIAAIDPSGEPDLTGAALDLVFGGMLGLRHRVECAAEFDHVPVAVVPVVKQCKIVADLVDCHGFPHSRAEAETYIGPPGTESDMRANRDLPGSFRAMVRRANRPAGPPASTYRATGQRRQHFLNRRARRSSRCDRAAAYR